MEDLILKKDFVTYEDFGAVGDGVTDDFAAIFKAHEYANEHKLPVLGTPGKKYYIFDTAMGEEFGKPAIIKTPVDWRGAEFIIDDTKLSAVKGTEYYGIAVRNIFAVNPDTEHEMFKIEDAETLARISREGINPQTKKIELGIDWDGPVMIIPYSSAHKVFRRRGYTQYSGEYMHEIIVLRPDGSVDPETPIMFNYESIDFIYVFKLDESSAITVENGVFTTLESKVNHKKRDENGNFYYESGYISRGINVSRSYTTVKNIKHNVKVGFTLRERVENDCESSSYWGFFNATNANHVTFKDCVMCGRISYGNPYSSSYNFSAWAVNKIVLDNCYQPNFWVTIDYEKGEVVDATEYAPGEIGNARKTSPDAISGMSTAVYYKGVKKCLCWGIGGTNYCKNMEYLNCTLSRFDAHAGLYHGKIINSNISSLELTGYGTFLLENSAWHAFNTSAPLLFLRGDYGYHWDGDIIVKNHKSYVFPEVLHTIAHFYYTNWYFGYNTRFPDITFDGLTYYDVQTDKPVDPGFEVTMFPFREEWKKMHLPDSGVPSIYAVLDEDGDGYIDEPRMDLDRDGKIDPPCDLDGDGKIGNTSLKYDDYFEKPNYRYGIEHPTSTANLNRCCPPAYIKIINNKDKDGNTVCRYHFMDTSKEGYSDGGWHRSADEPDRLGGYFGGTKFIYGDGEEDFFYGTKDASATDTFIFDEEYYIPPHLRK